MIEKEQVYAALRGVIHPELERDVVDLEMIKAVTLADGQVKVTLALPFLEVPLRDSLVESIRETIRGLDSGLEADVKLEEMGQRERAAFMARSQGGSDGVASANEISQVVAVLSGKGGVGKSSVAALLAVTLAQQGLRVGVLDADITGPSIPKMFGLHERPIGGPLGILPVRTPGGVLVMSINLLLGSEDQAVIWRGPLISNAIKQFWMEVVWGKLDFLVVDLPPGTSDASLTVMQLIPLSGVVLVTSPQDLAGMVVRKAAHMAREMGAPILGLVENMSYIDCPRCGERIEIFGPSQAQRTADQLGIPLMGRIPLDPHFARRCDTGTVEGYRSEPFASVAEGLLGRVPVSAAN